MHALAAGVREDHVPLVVARRVVARRLRALAFALEREKVRIRQDVEEDVGALAGAQGDAEHVHKVGKLLEVACLVRDLLDVCDRENKKRERVRGERAQFYFGAGRTASIEGAGPHGVVVVAVS